MSETMRVMQLQAPGPVEGSPLALEEMDRPTPGPREVLLRVLTCGVCRTDLHIVEGELDLPKLPIVPGHQIVGRVEEVGEGVTRFRPGDRVGVPWLHRTCGTCQFCQPGRRGGRGQENLCEDAQFTGFHVDGGFAEFARAPADFAYLLPDVFDDEHAAPLLCAGVIGMRSLRLSETQPGDRLGLFGFGASAHIVLQIAVHWGCEAYVFTRGHERRQLALDLGATWEGTSEEPPPEPLDTAIIFAPAGELVPRALGMLRKGGTLSLAGIHMSPIPEMEYRLLYHERTIRSVANSTRQDAEDLLRLAAEIPVRTEVEVFPLEEANTALQKLKRGEIRGAGVLRVAS